MRALVKEKPGQGFMRVVEMPQPEVSDNLVKIKIMYAGICGTDIHNYFGTFSNTKPPVIIGHEFSGVVVDVGPRVKRIRVGDRVTGETTFKSCGCCSYCITKDYNLCSNRLGIGSSTNGCMAEYMIMPEERLYVIPENVDDITAALSEPLACGVHAVIEKARTKAGDTVCVFGAGAIGQMVSQVAIACGAKVIMAGITKDTRRFEVAKKCGIYRTIDLFTENISEIIKEETENVGVDASFECSGASSSLKTAMEITKKKGKVVQMGVFPDNENSIPTDLILNKELEYIGSRSQKPSSWTSAISLLKEGKVYPKGIITHVAPLEEWERLFSCMRSGEGCKAVLCCS